MNYGRMKNVRKSVFHTICDITVLELVCLKSIDFIDVYRTGYHITEKSSLKTILNAEKPLFMRFLQNIPNGLNNLI